MAVEPVLERDHVHIAEVSPCGADLARIETRRPHPMKHPMPSLGQIGEAEIPLLRPTRPRPPHAVDEELREVPFALGHLAQVHFQQVLPLCSVTVQSPMTRPPLRTGASPGYAAYVTGASPVPESSGRNSSVRSSVYVPPRRSTRTGLRLPPAAKSSRTASRPDRSSRTVRRPCRLAWPRPLAFCRNLPRPTARSSCRCRLAKHRRLPLPLPSQLPFDLPVSDHCLSAPAMNLRPDSVSQE